MRSTHTGLFRECVTVAVTLCTVLCTEIQLGDRDKPMDVISRWAGLVHHYGGEKTEEIPQLYLRANVFAFPERHKHVSGWACAYVGVCLCGCVPVWVCACVGVCLCGCVPVWVCACGCVPVWVCACVGVCLCGRVPVWACACVGVCLCGRVPVWACACVGVCLCGCVPV